MIKMKRLWITLACNVLVCLGMKGEVLPEMTSATESACIVESAGNAYYVYKTRPSSVKMAWKDGKGNYISNLKNLESVLAGNGQKLLCAMNGGMYTQEQSPCGLYIEEGVTKRKVNKNFQGSGNFCLGFGDETTNGVFVTKRDGTAEIIKAKDFSPSGSYLYATQSGPILLWNGQINPKFTKNSKNVLVRNAVGVDSKGNVVLVMSKTPTSFYDLANLFLTELDCKNALYLDGVVSDMYIKGKVACSEQRTFGVMIYVAE